MLNKPHLANPLHRIILVHNLSVVSHQDEQRLECLWCLAQIPIEQQRLLWSINAIGTEFVKGVSVEHEESDSFLINV